MNIFEDAKKILDTHHLTITKEDRTRPWGGFYVIDESQAAEFAKIFFPEERLDTLNLSGRLSPKILLVAPQKRLSWQYHHRRAEIWKCIQGQLAVIRSSTDEESEKRILSTNETIKLQQGERHRLIGLDDWGMIAEIWQHTDASCPSDEDDIIRLQDDFGR
ncbi:phosphoheptose isomerase [Sediminibacterium goheungense]|uniref:Mannose-6-phosphate isomerase type 2 n=1 Tax=Sediminibacterium goheungense TaxID=1086393 RepID=A0A4R6IS81_9BACT|nr:phosphoheptose isomerase [Sediminibacterium goheungense]TDO25330.1 mannose-6-phosphate isomerase type 2 [Sediminibacterium goheungense]